MIALRGSGEEVRRQPEDRRQQKLKSVFSSLLRNRRKSSRRLSDRQKPHYTDVYPVTVLVQALGIMCLCILDAGFTLVILANGGVELNPVMVILLEFGPHAFFVVKFLVTAAGLFILVVHINFRLFRLIRMQHLLLALFLAYMTLINYQLTLLPGV